MKKTQWILIAFFLYMLITRLAFSADSIAPVTVTFTNIHDEGIYFVNGNNYYENSKLTFTNCVMYSGPDTNSAVQGLNGITIQAKVANTVTSTTYAATAISTNGGTWGVQVTLPTNNAGDLVDVEITITDSNTNIFTYPLKSMHTKERL